MKYAVINEQNNQVINVIELDSGAKWEAPAGHFIKQSDIAGIGMFYHQQEFLDYDPATV